MTNKRLDLSTVAPERALVSIDGTDFEMWSYEDFSLMEFGRIRRMLVRMSELEQLDSPTAEQSASHTALELEFLGLLLPDCPAELLARLPMSGRMRAITFFMGTLPPEALRAAEAQVAAMFKKSTGNTPLPGSSGTTAARGGRTRKKRPSVA